MSDNQDQQTMESMKDAISLWAEAHSVKLEPGMVESLIMMLLYAISNPRDRALLAMQVLQNTKSPKEDSNDQTSA